jgi:hypothetical protein
MTRDVRKVYVGVMLAGVLAGGAAFVLKIVEFLRTLDSPDVQGFVLVPVTVYFAVAAGFGFLFAWAWVAGHFRRIEEPKYTMLEQELEYDRLEAKGIEV